MDQQKIQKRYTPVNYYSNGKSRFFQVNIVNMVDFPLLCQTCRGLSISYFFKFTQQTIISFFNFPRQRSWRRQGGASMATETESWKCRSISSLIGVGSLFGSCLYIHIYIYGYPYIDIPPGAQFQPTTLFLLGVLILLAMGFLKKKCLKWDLVNLFHVTLGNSKLPI